MFKNTFFFQLVSPACFPACPFQVTKRLPLSLCSDSHKTTAGDVWRSGLFGGPETDSSVRKLKLTSVDENKRMSWKRFREFVSF